MTREGWRDVVIDAMHRHEAGDSALLDLLAQVLEEQDLAKGVLLRDKGYGCIGMPWVDVCAEIPRA